MSKAYEVAILGATPAGLTAALALARLKRRVVVVDAPAGATESPLADWAPRDLFDQAPFFRSLPKACGAQAFSAVRFYNADASKTAEYRHGKTAGYCIAAGRLPAALAALVRKAKVAMVSADARPTMDLREDQVRLRGSCDVEAQLLLIAQDCPAEVIAALALPVRNVPRSTLSVTGMDVSWTAAKIRKHFPPCLHIVDLPGRSDLGMFFPAGNMLHVRIMGQAGGARPEALAALLTMLREAGIVPPDMPTAEVRGAVWNPPAGVALDLETHVAKRTLLIGTAGGFTGLMTGQTVSPSVRSALLAAAVAERALGATDPQGALGSYKNEWRRALADYLRPPNTSIHLLLPLVFINNRMVARFARAMLYGENI